MFKHLTRLLALSVVTGLTLTVTAAPASADPGPVIVSEWDSGTMAGGASKTWHWNNANPLTRTYEVSFKPVVAAGAVSCQFEVTRSWYEQQWGGEREFWFTVTNVGSSACGARVVLNALPQYSSWPTGSLGPGGWRSFHWNNANPLSAAFLPGLSPTGATSANPCRLEITNMWYERQPSGEREFWFTVKNIGTITCSGDVRLARNTLGAVHRPGTLDSVWAGQTTTISQHDNSNNAQVVHAFAPGLIPSGASGSHPCKIEIVRHWYGQTVYAGVTTRVFYIQLKNIGSIDCIFELAYTRLHSP